MGEFDANSHYFVCEDICKPSTCKHEKHYTEDHCPFL